MSVFETSATDSTLLARCASPARTEVERTISLQIFPAALARQQESSRSSATARRFHSAKRSDRSMMGSHDIVPGQSGNVYLLMLIWLQFSGHLMGVPESW